MVTDPYSSRYCPTFGGDDDAEDASALGLLSRRQVGCQVEHIVLVAEDKETVLEALVPQNLLDRRAARQRCDTG